MLFKQLQQKVQQRRETGLLRQTRVFDAVDARHLTYEGRAYLNFSSNDYLGIGSDSKPQKAETSGAMASPLVVGRTKIHQQLEHLLLEWLGAPASHACMLFSSGYAANSGLVHALFNEKVGNALLLQDRLNHASLLASGALVQSQGYVRQFRFKHNDLEHLSELVTKHEAMTKPSLAITEGVFSMDGDAPDLAQFHSLLSSHSIPWMLDDAHGIGALGAEGRGSLDAQGLSLEDCDILVVTFGKAVGAQGAAVIAKQGIIDYLTNFSKEYIYSTHLSPMQAGAVINNIQAIRKEQWRRDKLSENIDYFRSNLASTNYSLMASQSAIQPLIVGDERDALQLSELLQSSGIWASAMRYPTVAKGAARLRITLTTKHEKEDLDRLLELLND